MQLCLIVLIEGRRAGIAKAERVDSFLVVKYSGEMTKELRSSTASDADPAVVGVIVAGVLASFVIPGPFDWGSTLIGAVLLLVLIGYGTRPTTWRAAVGTASAAAFTMLLALGRPLNLVTWPHDRKLDDYVPDPNAGTNLWVVWGICFF
jgi:hypothetical protein